VKEQQILRVAGCRLALRLGDLHSTLSRMLPKRDTRLSASSLLTRLKSRPLVSTSNQTILWEYLAHLTIM